MRKPKEVKSEASAKQYQIEKGVPIPEIDHPRIKYPFKKMEVGDSFPFPPEDFERVVSASAKYAASHGVKFSRSKPHSRIWRVA